MIRSKSAVLVVTRSASTHDDTPRFASVDYAVETVYDAVTHGTADPVAYVDIGRTMYGDLATAEAQLAVSTGAPETTPARRQFKCYIQTPAEDTYTRVVAALDWVTVVEFALGVAYFIVTGDA